MIPLYYVLAGVALILIWAIAAYNRLIVLRNRADEALSDIDVQLKRRFDLIPNLVETVKGYMAHERTTLQNITEARAAVAQSRGNPLDRDKEENALSSTLKTLFAVAENYPQLKANENFKELQSELTDTEDKIQASRRFYNSTVRDLNSHLETFPNSLIGRTFGFKEKKFFEVAEAAERQAVKVDFGG